MQAFPESRPWPSPTNRTCGSRCPRHARLDCASARARNDPFRHLVGDDWQKEHWFASRAERDAALAQMSGRYVYFRPGDAPTLDFEKVDP